MARGQKGSINRGGGGGGWQSLPGGGAGGGGQCRINIRNYSWASSPTGQSFGKLYQGEKMMADLQTIQHPNSPYKNNTLVNDPL